MIGSRQKAILRKLGWEDVDEEGATMVHPYVSKLRDSSVFLWDDQCFDDALEITRKAFERATRAVIGARTATSVYRMTVTHV